MTVADAVWQHRTSTELGFSGNPRWVLQILLYLPNEETSLCHGHRTILPVW